jgi:AIPR protein
MSSLRVNQIRGKLSSMFGQFLDTKDIGENDKERQQKILSRCLAAFAVYINCGCSEKEAAEAVWDGTDDNGIDAAYFDASDKRVVFVQSKWINKGSGEPEARDLSTFVKGVRDAIEQESTNFHARLHGRFSDIALRIATPGTSVEIVVVTTGASELSHHGTTVLDDFVGELNGGDPIAIASKSTMGLSEVYARLANDLGQSTVELDATILEWSYVSSPYPAYFGVIDGLSLKSWWRKHGKSLVSANIRHSLGSTEVNNEIRNSASLAPQKFWYFNNGITLTANDALKAPAGAASRSAGVFSFSGASIVNGAQTVSSLARVDEDDQLGNVRVPIRVILLKDAPAEFGDEVTRTNNLQNRVESRDFVAQDPEQKRLRQEMAIEGIDYQFVRSEDAVPTTTACELVEVTTALACATGESSYAVQIKSGIGRFFGDLQKAPYKALFNPTTSGAKAFNATLLLREVEQWIDNTKTTIPKKSGPRWGTLVHGNRILAAAVFRQIGIEKLTQPIADFREFLQKQKISQICSAVHNKMVTAVEEEYPGKFLAVLFKNSSMSKDVFDRSS